MMRRVRRGSRTVFMWPPVPPFRRAGAAGCSELLPQPRILGKQADETPRDHQHLGRVLRPARLRTNLTSADPLRPGPADHLGLPPFCDELLAEAELAEPILAATSTRHRYKLTARQDIAASYYAARYRHPGELGPARAAFRFQVANDGLMNKVSVWRRLTMCVGFSASEHDGMGAEDGDRWGLERRQGE